MSQRFKRTFNTIYSDYIFMHLKLTQQIRVDYLMMIWGVNATLLCLRMLKFVILHVEFN